MLILLSKECILSGYDAHDAFLFLFLKNMVFKNVKGLVLPKYRTYMFSKFKYIRKGHRETDKENKHYFNKKKFKG